MVVPREVKETDTLSLPIEYHRRFCKKIERKLKFISYPLFSYHELNKVNLLLSGKIRKYEGFYFEATLFVIMKFAFGAMFGFITQVNEKVVIKSILQ
jgi:hypothetical protein